MRTHQWLVVLVSLVLPVACSSNSTDSDPPLPGEVSTITVTPNSSAIELGTTLALTAVARDGSGAVVSVDFTWSSSSEATATVNTTGLVTAVAVGTTSIVASYAAVHSAAVTATVTAASSWPNTGTSSSAAIDAAVAAGTLTAEQGLTYKVYASFADRRLPAQYRGPVPTTIDNPILGEVSSRYASLSLAARTSLAPFFRTPSDPDGWYATRFPAGAAMPAPAGGPGAASLRAAEDCTTLATRYVRRTTAHFAVLYRIGDENGPAMADLITPELEAIWTAEVGLFGRTPMSDAALVQPHGCDGLLDVWLVSATGELGAGRAEDVPEHALAWNTKYQPGCAPGPSFLGIWSQPSVNLNKARAALAHEFFHVLQVGSYTFGAACTEFNWLGEATGNWAMDLVAPSDNIEHGWAAEYAGVERLAPIDQPGNGIEEETTNGYNDYPFLLYLARTYSNTVVKNIWDATGAGNSVDAIVAALEPHGGIDDIWPKFALSQWNNYKDHDQDQLHTQDNLIWGMREIFDLGDAGNPNAPKSDHVDLPAAGRENIGLMALAGVEGFKRLTILADYLKFTDANVAPVLYLNPLAMGEFPHLKIQALIKMGGSWKAPEDWTHVASKAWCRDIVAERIEELVLIYSNSNGVSTGAGADPIHLLVLPNIGVSNVGCNKWIGTSSIALTAPSGGSTTSGTNLVFERERPAGAPLPDGSGQEAFTLISGGVTGSSSALCITTSAAGPAVADDGRLLIVLDNLFFNLPGVDPPTRDILQGIGSTTLSTTAVNSCVPLTNTNPAVWSWLEIPVLGESQVSADGRTISGNVLQSGPAGDQRLIWNLTAVREP